MSYRERVRIQTRMALAILPGGFALALGAGLQEDGAPLLVVVGLFVVAVLLWTVIAVIAWRRFKRNYY